MRTRFQRLLGVVGGAFSALILMTCASGGTSLPPREKRPEVVPIARPAPTEVESLLQVPSPDWRDQILYLIVTDRFDDGNPGNSDQKAGEYNPSENAYYSGGDLQGILNNLDYIKGLGMTSLWITPPVANQWWDPIIKYSGYHGYWARDFKSVDEHYGTLEDYKLLSATLHKNQMYLVQDIVLNHTGNFFYYAGGFDKAQPHLNFKLNLESKPGFAPTQFPFSQNDVTKPDQKKAAIFHWTPNIRDYNNPSQMLTYQMSSLDDLNTTNPVVRQALRDSYNYWIKTVGVDGFRIDTIKYVEHDTLNDFLWNKEDKTALGAIEYAKTLGKNNFFVTGENLVNGKPFDEAVDKDIASFQGTVDKPEVPYPLNFTLAWDIRSVFTEGVPTSALTFRIASQQKNYRDSAYLPNFIDSHDIDRFLRAGNQGAFQQALAMIFTIPGIPTILYGTEQNFDQSRAALFAKGYSSGGKDHFDPSNPSYQWIKRLTELRKSNNVFTRGTLKVLKDNTAGAGVFAYTMEKDGKKALVLFNTANFPALMDNLETGLAPGSVFESALSNNTSMEKDLSVLAKGRINLELPAQCVAVYFYNGKSGSPIAESASGSISSVKSGQIFTGNTTITGVCQGAEKVDLVIDGNLSKAVAAVIKDGKTWSADLEAENLSSGTHGMNIRVTSKTGWTTGEAVSFKVDIPFKTVLTEKSPVAHSKGPKGVYLYPTDASFKTQMDIEEVSLAVAGKNLKITIKPKGGISTTWNPQYGFDHVSYNIFLGLPGQKGATVMPNQNGQVPEGFTWNYMALTGGWANFLYSAEGAGEKKYGTPIKPASIIEIDKTAGTLSFTILAEALGFPKTLSGTRVYINTWDYDGIESSNRKLEIKPQAYIMGGGDGAKDPLYMEDTKILMVP